ncbi:MAG: hypothetical protein GXO65_03970 [Euryarchaeota archaeon]|nr:hypothetical protein [Euryarchaeota archaeon]
MRRREYLLLLGVYLAGLYLRLAPRLEIDPHLLTFQGDIWYRLCMAQYVQDHWRLPEPDIRYLAYGWVPMWYPPLSPVIFALTGSITGLDIPTVSSRLVPFIEALTPLSIYPLAAYLYNRTAAAVAVVTLALTPSFVFWSGISDPQSFTLFLIPLLVLAWVRHSAHPIGNRGLALLGVVLAFNFLLHLSYFLAVLVLLMATLALVLSGARRSLFLDWLKVVLLSQALRPGGSSPSWPPCPTPSPSGRRTSTGGG